MPDRAGVTDPDQGVEGAASGRRGLALAAVAIAVLTWGWSNVAIKLLSTTGLVASFYRLWLAIPPLWLCAACTPRLRRRLTLLSGTLGHLLTNWAHPHLPAFVVSVMLLGVPVLACAGAAVWLGEWLTPLQLAGGAVVLAAIGAIVASTRGETAEELAESAAETDAP